MRDRLPTGRKSPATESLPSPRSSSATRKEERAEIEHIKKSPEDFIFYRTSEGSLNMAFGVAAQYANGKVSVSTASLPVKTAVSILKAAPIPFSGALSSLVGVLANTNEKRKNYQDTTTATKKKEEGCADGGSDEERRDFRVGGAYAALLWTFPDAARQWKSSWHRCPRRSSTRRGNNDHHHDECACSTHSPGAPLCFILLSIRWWWWLSRPR